VRWFSDSTASSKAALVRSFGESPCRIPL
jgi:hypothetical protein